MEASNGATAKLLLGTLEVPASYIAGFKRGMGADLAVKEDSREAGEEVVFKGAILVSDDVWSSLPKVVGPSAGKIHGEGWSSRERDGCRGERKPLSLQKPKSRPQRLRGCCREKRAPRALGAR